MEDEEDRSENMGTGLVVPSTANQRAGEQGSLAAALVRASLGDDHAMHLGGECGQHDVSDHVVQRCGVVSCVPLSCRFEGGGFKVRTFRSRRLRIRLPDVFEEDVKQRIMIFCRMETL